MAGSANVAIVTGGSRGIGRACAFQLGAAGYTVVVNYANDAPAAQNVALAVEAAGGHAMAIAADVSKLAEVRSLFAIADTLGTLKVLVNNAGIMERSARVDETSAERLERIVSVNVVGAFLCAREAVKRMSTKHGGRGGAIVNLSSAAAVHGAPGLAVDYAMTKGAIDTLTLGLGREVAAEGVRVNAVRPGIIDTEIHAKAGLPNRVAELKGTIPIKREGTADEVANAVLWLCSDAASYVTGAILNVTGGRA